MGRAVATVLQLQTWDDTPRGMLGTWLPAVLRALLRQLPALVAVLCVTAQLGASLHVALVKHVRCAEHGQWEHEDAHARTASTASVDSVGVAPAQDSDAGEAQGVEADGVEAQGVEATLREGAEPHHHDHCPVCAERKDLLEAETAWGWVFASENPVHVQQWSAPVSRPVATVYVYAPKNSPPNA